MLTSKAYAAIIAILLVALSVMGYSVSHMKKERNEAVRNLVVAQDVARTLKRERDAANEKLSTAATSAADEARREMRAELDVVAADTAARVSAAKRVRDAAEGRAASYLRRAEAGEASCRVLADSAAKLDRSLAEGRGLVAELGGVVRERDSQIEFLSKLLLGSNGVGFIP